MTPSHRTPPNLGVTAPGFGVRLRAARLARGLTQDALAQAAGVSAAHLVTLEHGRARPGRYTVAALAAGLELPASVLIGDRTFAAADSLPPALAGALADALGVPLAALQPAEHMSAGGEADPAWLWELGELGRGLAPAGRAAVLAFTRALVAHPAPAASCRTGGRNPRQLALWEDGP